MALAKIQHLEMIGPKTQQESILSLLQSLGVVQIESLADRCQDGISPQAVGTEALRWEELLSKFDYLLKYLGAFREKPASLLAQFASAKIPIAEVDFQLNDASRGQLISVWEQTRQIEAKLPELSRLQEDLERQRTALEPWQEFAFPLEELKRGIYVRVEAVKLPERQLQTLEESLRAKLASPFVLLRGEGQKLVPLFLVVRKEEEKAASGILSAAGAEQVSFPPGKGTAKERLADLQQQLSRLRARQDELLAQAKTLAAENLDKIVLAYDYAASKLERARIRQQLLATDTAFGLEGWILQKDVARLKAELAKLELPLYFAVREPEAAEERPVALENNELARPFESILEMYSPPKAGEVDPTPWVGPFFSLFFGIMLTDAGYGVVLALAAVLLLKKVRMEEGGRKLLLVMFWGGVGSGVAGALAGGWFGDLFGLPPLWFNPIEKPLQMLALSFGLGLIHIFVGMGLELYDNVRHGDVWAGICDQGFWYALILGLVFMFFPSLNAVGGKLAIIGAGGVVLTGGRHQKNFLLRLGSGLASLYNLSGILGDVLSYSRLLALGLATGVIANVINMLAKMTLSFPYGIGYLTMALILLGGHAFNLFIGIMGSYVHTSRLQYVEFFGKFFEGGGRIFSPFKIEQKYTYFKEEMEDAQ